MSNHFIKTLRLDLTAPSEQEGFQMQQGFSELIRTKLGQKMEDIFDRFGSDQNIKIENLELEIQGVEAENWEEDFIEKFSKQLIVKLKEWQSNAASSPSFTNSEKQSDWNSFLFFLKNGTLPWQGNQLIISNLNTFMKKEIVEKPNLKSLDILIKSNPNVLIRLINHLSNEILELILHEISQTKIALISTFNFLKKNYSSSWSKNEIKLEFWKIAFQFLGNFSSKKIGATFFEKNIRLEIITQSILFFSQKKSKTKSKLSKEDLLFQTLKTDYKKSNLELGELVNIFFQQKKFLQKSFTKSELLKKELLKKEKIKKQSKSTAQEKSEFEEISKDGFFINNAGLVILNPYLNLFFQKLNLVNGKNFSNEDAQNQAALILQYLTTEIFLITEHELILNKILCNIPLQNPIPIELFLNQEQKNICEGLLNGVIKNWSAIGNTSPQGFRESFLQRNGKLTKKENGDWLLQVESKSFDVLLSSLPWAISMVKLPWMEKMIWVEWQ